MTDLRKPVSKKLSHIGTGKTAAETPRKLFESAARLKESNVKNRSRLDPQPSRYDSLSSTQNYESMDHGKIGNPFN
jgi:hypothetical protein